LSTVVDIQVFVTRTIEEHVNPRRCGACDKGKGKRKLRTRLPAKQYTEGQGSRGSGRLAYSLSTVVDNIKVEK
jgi:hypothetical protein